MEKEFFELLSNNFVLAIIAILAGAVCFLFRLFYKLQTEFREYIKEEGKKTSELLVRATLALERIEKLIEK